MDNYTHYYSSSNNSFFDLSDMKITFLFNFPLETREIRNAFEELINRWPILGGKIHTTTKPTSWTYGSNVHLCYDAIPDPFPHEIPKAKTSQKSAPHESLNVDFGELLQQYLPHCRDKSSILKLHVVVFQDATLLQFILPHTIGDACSFYEVTKAFCKILQGESIPPLHLPPDTGDCHMSQLIDIDPLGLQGCATMSLQHDNWGFRSRDMANLVYKSSRDGLLRSVGWLPVVNPKTLLIPWSWVKDTQEEANRQLQKGIKFGSLEGSTGVSKNDIIAAWYLKLVGMMKPDSDPDVEFWGAINFRSCLNPGPQNYLHNSFCLHRCTFSPKMLRQLSVARIASLIRQSILLYRKPESIKCYLQMIEANLGRRPVPKIKSHCHNVVILTSWAAFDFANLEFFGSSKSHRLAAFVPTVSFRSGSDPFLTSILWIDCDGDFRMRMALPEPGWKLLEQSISWDWLFPKSPQ